MIKALLSTFIKQRVLPYMEKDVAEAIHTAYHTGYDDAVVDVLQCLDLLEDEISVAEEISTHDYSRIQQVLHRLRDKVLEGKEQ